MGDLPIGPEWNSLKIFANITNLFPKVKMIQDPMHQIDVHFRTIIKVNPKQITIALFNEDSTETNQMIHNKTIICILIFNV